MYDQALERCKTDFNAYIATTPDQTPASYFASIPSRPEWQRGERLVVCFAVGRNGENLTGSVRGGAR